MEIRAAILWERGQPLSVESAELDPPGPGEVLVEVKAAGVCHSDLHPARDEWPVKTPLVLGHEGAGIVREVGPGVTNVAPGDRVVLCWAPACGQCAACVEGRATLCDRLDRTNYRSRLPSGATRLHARGQDLNPFLGTACFATHVVVAAEAAVRIDNPIGDHLADNDGNIPFDALATVGCAVVTGVGAVLNAAKAAKGTSTAVIGAGGVGLNAIQGAVLAGCARIIAIDTKPQPLALAKSFGATDALTPDGAADQIKQLTGGRGVDLVVDTVGSPATLTNALAYTRKGGTVVVTGLSRVDAIGNIQLFPFVMQEKKLIGSAYGSSRPPDDIRRIVEWYREGRLNLRGMVSRTYPLADINLALDALAGSEGARGVVIP